jgi:hypothetical protein
MMMQSSNGEDIEAVVSPELGMSLLDFSACHVPLLQKSRKQDFLQGRKGLGPVILPHFNQRPSFPKVPEEVLASASHTDYLRTHGVEDPFQHGIGRYAQWISETKCTDESVSVKGNISGNTEYNGVPVGEIVGFDFTAFVTYALSEGNMTVTFDITSDEPAAAGIHFYYRLPETGGSQTALSVEKTGKNDNGSLFEFSHHQKDGKFYILPIEGNIDAEFTPAGEEGGYARYKLITPEFRLDTRVLAKGDPEHAFESVVVFHPEGSDFVCIEPLSDPNPLFPWKKKFRGEISLHPILQRG